MNMIRKSMENIRASEELKADTIRYLNEQRSKKRKFRSYRMAGYAVAAVCLLLLFGAGGYSLYSRPVSYISMDINPSIELGINKFGQVVDVDSYNEDGRDILANVTVKNISYMQAIDRLMKAEEAEGFLTEGSLLVFTVISDRPEDMVSEIEKDEAVQYCEVLIYTSDMTCWEEAHRYGMSFGKYRAYQELAGYDGSITVEDCHGMTMGDIQNRIEGCKHHQNATDLEMQKNQENQGNQKDQENQENVFQNGHHGSHHGQHRNSR